jgi:hypothetical protein
MRYLQQELGLQKSNDIVVRASSRNSVGWSQTVDMCQPPVKVLGLPDDMSAPTLTKEHPSKITATWQQCTSKGCYY